MKKLIIALLVFSSCSNAKKQVEPVRARYELKGIWHYANTDVRLDIKQFDITYIYYIPEEVGTGLEQASDGPHRYSYNNDTLKVDIPQRLVNGHYLQPALRQEYYVTFDNEDKMQWEVNGDGPKLTLLRLRHN